MARGFFDEYELFVEKYGIKDNEVDDNLSDRIKIGLRDFVSSHNNVAIYCYGLHTKMLMSDFMFELKSVKYIVENYSDVSDSGFEIIKDGQLEEKAIDGVIVSSYKFKNLIKKDMSNKHQNIDVFDLYEYLEKNGINVACEYYRCSHPYHHYHIINSLKREIREHKINDDKLYDLYDELISEFVHLKDFRLASETAYDLYGITKKSIHKEKAEELKRLYESELEAIRDLSNAHVIMLCVDGLKRSGIDGGLMPKLRRVLKEKTLYYSNAYAYSTSTYESLLPVYSENYDQRTKYYAQNYVEGKNCRFIDCAKKEGRTVHFYAHMDKMIDDECITYALSSYSVTQLIWRFLTDASKEEKGLYYLHILYESHYSFSNPYTEDNLIAEGTAMLFDFLDKHGGKLRTDYVNQNKDALRYIDDTLSPILEAMPCKFVLYADHGNIVLDKDTKLQEVHKNYLSCHEDWLRIPVALSSPSIHIGTDDALISLSSLNDMIIALMEDKNYIHKYYEYIKFGRSELYNPDFKHIYKILGEEQKLEAFEGFIFAEGYKLVIYANGFTELFDLEDNRIDNKEKIDFLMKIVKKDITVTDRYDKSGV